MLALYNTVELRKQQKKIKIHAQYKILRNEVKMKTNQAKESYSQNLFKKKQSRSIKNLGSYSLYCQCGKKK